MDYPLHDDRHPVLHLMENSPANYLEGRRQNFLAMANAGHQPELRWVSRIERYGVTSSLLGKVNDTLRDFRGTAELEFNADTGSFGWAIRLPPTLDIDSDMIAAFEVAQFLIAGLLDGLKRCDLKDCKKYFVGGPRAKWCSNTCGSKYRVREKRKYDRSRGIA